MKSALKMALQMGMKMAMKMAMKSAIQPEEPARKGTFSGHPSKSQRPPRPTSQYYYRQLKCLPCIFSHCLPSPTFLPQMPFCPHTSCKCPESFPQLLQHRL